MVIVEVEGVVGVFVVGWCAAAIWDSIGGRVFVLEIYIYICIHVYVCVISDIVNHVYPNCMCEVVCECVCMYVCMSESVCWWGLHSYVYV